MGLQYDSRLREQQRRSDSLAGVDDAFIDWSLMQGDPEPARRQARDRHAHITELLADERTQ